MVDPRIILLENYTTEDYRWNLFTFKGIGLWGLCHLMTRGYKMHIGALVGIKANEIKGLGEGSRRSYFLTADERG